MKQNFQKVYFIGIGGAGMSNLAFLTRDLGYFVFGSDIMNSDIIKKLRRKSIKVFIGHKKENIESIKPDIVVYSSAIKNNSELEWAKKNKIKIQHRFEFLSQLIKYAKTIGISGTHGKTTTTSMIGFLLQKAGIPVYVYLGGENKCLKNTKITSKSTFVVETDESDKSFLFFDPEIAIITNIDKDHLSNYHYNFNELKNAFRDFIKGKGQRRLTVLCADDKNLMKIYESLKNKNNFLTYGLTNKKATLRAQNISFSKKGIKADLFLKNKKLGHFQFNFLGEKILLDALGAILIAHQFGISIQKSIKYLKYFTLPKRRTEIIGEKKEILIIDDHADHPTEVKTTLKSLKVLKRRIIAIYEPHRYTRMKMLGEKVGQAFDDADVIISLDICPAFEKPIKGITGKKVNQWIKKYNPQKKVFYIEKLDEVPKFLRKIVQPNDLIITLGPGTIKGLARKIYQSL
ncbi:MAG: UDP-N-acetylmuramate--L-alanine ligase [Minisyncoccia bacterium]